MTKNILAKLRKDPSTGRWSVVHSKSDSKEQDQKSRYQTCGDYISKRERIEFKKKSCVWSKQFSGGKRQEKEVLFGLRWEGDDVGITYDNWHDDDWEVMVVRTDYAQVVQRRENILLGEYPFLAEAGFGIHELIIEDPTEDHKPLGVMPVNRTKLILLAMLYRLMGRVEGFPDLDNERVGIPLKEIPGIRHVSFFHNHRTEAGGSLEHPHCQIIASPMIPSEVDDELDYVFERQKQPPRRCVYCDIIDTELAIRDGATKERTDEEPTRILFETEHFVAIQPFCSIHPFETWLIPRHHSSSFGDLGTVLIKGGISELDDLAALINTVVGRLYASLDDPAYNLIIKTEPITRPDEQNKYSHYHWHIRIEPRGLMTAGGYELSTGIFPCRTPPEETNSFLRKWGRLGDQDKTKMGTIVWYLALIELAKNQDFISYLDSACRAISTTNKNDIEIFETNYEIFKSSGAFEKPGGNHQQLLQLNIFSKLLYKYNREIRVNQKQKDDNSKDGAASQEKDNLKDITIFLTDIKNTLNNIKKLKVAFKQLILFKLKSLPPTNREEELKQTSTYLKSFIKSQIESQKNSRRTSIQASIDKLKKIVGDVDFYQSNSNFLPCFITAVTYLKNIQNSISLIFASDYAQFDEVISLLASYEKGKDTFILKQKEKLEEDTIFSIISLYKNKFYKYDNISLSDIIYYWLDNAYNYLGSGIEKEFANEAVIKRDKAQNILNCLKCAFKIDKTEEDTTIDDFISHCNRTVNHIKTVEYLRNEFKNIPSPTLLSLFGITDPEIVRNSDPKSGEINIIDLEKISRYHSEIVHWKPFFEEILASIRRAPIKLINILTILDNGAHTLSNFANAQRTVKKLRISHPHLFLTMSEPPDEKDQRLKPKETAGDYYGPHYRRCPATGRWVLIPGVARRRNAKDIANDQKEKEKEHFKWLPKDAENECPFCFENSIKSKYIIDVAVHENLPENVEKIATNIEKYKNHLGLNQLGEVNALGFVIKNDAPLLLTSDGDEKKLYINPTPSPNSNKIVSTTLPSIGGVVPFEKMEGYGVCEVIVIGANLRTSKPSDKDKLTIIKDNRHDYKRSIEQIHINAAISVMRNRLKAINELNYDPKCNKPKSIRHIVIFGNHRKEAGAKLSHPNWQIIASPIVPTVIQRELSHSRRYYDTYFGRCCFCDMIQAETNIDALIKASPDAKLPPLSTSEKAMRKLGSRIIDQNEHFIAITPFASRAPFEIWILPKEHQSSIIKFFWPTDKNDQATDVVIANLTKILSRTLLSLYEVAGDPGYSMIIQNAPLSLPRDKEDSQNGHYHWRIIIETQRLAIPAGYEHLTGIWSNVTPPEDAAKSLKENIEKQKARTK